MTFSAPRRPLRRPGGANATAASFTVTSAGNPNIGSTGASYGAVAPTALTNVSQFSAAQNVRRTPGGIGVCSEGGSGSECSQVDTNGNPNEILRLSSASGNLRLSSVPVNQVDASDSFRLYGGGAGGALTLLGFGGIISTGLDAFRTTTLLSNSHGGTWRIDFMPTLSGYQDLYFTVRTDGADGYRLQSVTGAVVPEPETWALMIADFGLVGAAARRRRPARVAA